MSMRVTVTAFGDLRRYLLDGAPERTVELADGATLTDVAGALGAEPDELPLARRGAEIVRELTDTDYGSHDFGVRDPEGHVWSFGTYRPQAESQ